MGIAAAEIDFDKIHWYVPPYTPPFNNRENYLNNIYVKHQRSFDILNDLFL